MDGETAAGLEQRVREFVARERAVPAERLRPDTTLFGDLGVDGDDAADLFAAFGREFGVDLRGLELGRHFGPEGLPPTFPSEWVRDFLRSGSPEQRAGLEPVAIADLVRAAVTKRWSDARQGAGGEPPGSAP